MLTRGVAFVIGLFLLAVWIAGLSLHTPAWITWLSFLGGLVSLLIGIVPVRAGAMALPFLAGLGMLAIWIVALTTHTTAWITWCTFGAACALLVEAFGGGFPIQHKRTA